VYVVRDGKAYQVPVEIGGRAENRVEITRGLTGDEQVIVSGKDLVGDERYHFELGSAPARGDEPRCSCCGAPREWGWATAALLLATPQTTQWGFAQCADVPSPTS